VAPFFCACYYTPVGPGCRCVSEETLLVPVFQNELHPLFHGPFHLDLARSCRVCVCGDWNPNHSVLQLSVDFFVQDGESGSCGLIFAPDMIGFEDRQAIQEDDDGVVAALDMSPHLSFVMSIESAVGQSIHKASVQDIFDIRFMRNRFLKIRV
jgi:hypothetical protein